VRFEYVESPYAPRLGVRVSVRDPFVEIAYPAKNDGIAEIKNYTDLSKSVVNFARVNLLSMRRWIAQVLPIFEDAILLCLISNVEAKKLSNFFVVWLVDESIKFVAGSFPQIWRETLIISEPLLQCLNLRFPGRIDRLDVGKTNMDKCFSGCRKKQAPSYQVGRLPPAVRPEAQAR